MVHNKIPVLITGAGSELAFSVIKACKMARGPFRLLGCDMDPKVLGRHWCDGFESVPSAKNAADYIGSLERIVARHKIRVVIPTADAEFPVLAKQKKHFAKEHDCHILVNDCQEYERFINKWSAWKWFSAHGIPSPATVPASGASEKAISEMGWQFPVVIKPQIGGGAREIFRAASWGEVERLLPLVPDALIQECLLPDNEEYTAGSYRGRNGEIETIVFKRVLKFGMTYYAETVERPELDSFCGNVIRNTALTGSNNIQFRVTADGPKVLEINPRFSGTCGIRAAFGFNDVEMWIRDALGLPPERPGRKKGGRVYRYMHEEYVFDGDVHGKAST